MKCKEYKTKSGKPIRLWHGDCMTFMNGIPNDNFDLAIVDPPYGKGMSGGNVGYKGFNNFERKEWDNDIPTSEYFDLLFQISKNQIIFGSNYFPLPTSKGFYVWDKGEGFKNRTYAEAELAWASFKNGKTFKYDPLCNGDYKGKIHPTQKPVRVYRDILARYTKKNDTILDTHGGSMSLGIACYIDDFELDIIELDEDYYLEAVNRFENHIAQKTLF